MRLLPLAALLLTTSPVFAQSRVYTNADLTSNPVTWTRTVTPEEWQGLADRQFVPPPPKSYGPVSIGIYSSPTAGPFGEFPSSVPTRRLDGDPPAIYGLPLWGLHGFHGRHDRRLNRSLRPMAPSQPPSGNRVVSRPAQSSPRTNVAATAGVRRPEWQP